MNLGRPRGLGALSDGLRAAGVDVVDVGMVPTPVGYFAASVPLQLPAGERRVDSCMVVTGSHNPPDYNGFKMVLRGAAIYGEQIQSLYKRIVDEYQAKLQGRPDDVVINLVEVAKENWSFGHGIAQYAT